MLRNCTGDWWFTREITSGTPSTAEEISNGFAVATDEVSIFEPVAG
jgi:hypothetical protein